MKSIAHEFLEISPELYSNKPCLYQVISADYGLYTKHDAEIICSFMRANMAKIIIKKEQQNEKM
jgi:hypothetical protein